MALFEQRQCVHIFLSFISFQIHYGDIAGGLCSSYNDPRIITFDFYSYDTQAIGQFYLIRSTDPDSPASF